MSNRPNPRARKRAAAARRPAPASPSRRPVLIALAAAAVVAAAVAIAVSAVTSGDDTDLAQVQPVTLQGDVLVPFPGAAADPAVGAVAPNVTGRSFDDTPVAIGADGRPAVVVFLAHWCPHCQREVPRIVSWLQAGGLPPEVDLVAVATGTSSDAPNYPPSRWLEREGWTLPVLADDETGRTASAFGVTGFPFFVVLDGQHRVLGRVSGELSIEELETLVDVARASAA